jgi:hypothetical protein
MNTSPRTLAIPRPWPARRVLLAVILAALIVLAAGALVRTWDDDDPAPVNPSTTPAAVVPHEDPLVTRFGQQPHEDPLVTRFEQQPVPREAPPLNRVRH